MLLGCIADDLTGATDLALTLTREGLRTVQSTGLPRPDLDLSGVDALVVALKSRTIPAADAVAQSLAAAAALRRLGAQRYLFKYCSTFDSTDGGNIGPVAEALLEFLGAGQTIACPAFPRAGRTVYAGHLFVNGALLSDSPMNDHPLTPMRDSDLKRVLGRQTRLDVGLIGFDDVDRGPQRIRAALEREAAAGRPISVADALTDRHLRDLGSAIGNLMLVTGGSGIALGLPVAYRTAGLIPALTPPPSRMAAAPGRRAILAGSCSAATRAQVAAAAEAGIPAFQLDPLAIAAARQSARHVLEWIEAQDTTEPVLIFSSADPEAVRSVQETLGREVSGNLVENALAEVASALPDRGFTRIIVAGGETSGAVMQALGGPSLAIGPEIDPGVPWTRTLDHRGLALALKSGNFGAPDFFLKAWHRLD